MIRMTSGGLKGMDSRSNAPSLRRSIQRRSPAMRDVTITQGGAGKSWHARRISRQVSGYASSSQSTTGTRCVRKWASVDTSVELGWSVSRQFGYKVRLEFRKDRARLNE